MKYKQQQKIYSKHFLNIYYKKLSGIVNKYKIS